MARYARILLSLAVLAALYWGLGGFGDKKKANDVPDPSPETGAAEAVASEQLASAPAIGGPEDAAPMGLGPVGPGFEHLDPEAARSGLALEHWEALTIGRGESFYVALQRAGLDHETIMATVDACEEHTNLKRVQRGDEFLLSRDAEEGLRALRFDIDNERFLLVRAVEAETGRRYEAEMGHYPVERDVRAARGSIHTNLFDALKAQSVDPVLADQLAEILGWNIDFFRDLRVGDEFELLYAEYHSGERKVRDPEVLAVHFTNRGRTYSAYRYTNDLDLAAYYDGEGGSLERQFLRAPLKYSRISSNYSHRRLHPVLKRYRPHYGVDYAAPTGTPVFATADGTIIERTRNGGSGNFVGLRHGNGYESYYLHLSRFAKGQGVGQRVKQGTVIGYVGQTGWATGPHLDYRIKKSGKWVNPRKLSLPPADPVSEERRPDYLAHAAELDAMLVDALGSSGPVVLDDAPTADVATD